MISLKVLNVSTRGSLAISSPLAFAEGLFSILKEGFIKNTQY